MTSKLEPGPTAGSKLAGQAAPRGWRWQRLMLPAIVLGAFGLRLIRLGVDSLWYDETVSVFLAGQPVPDLIAHTARDIHPPGYYLLLRGWLLLTGYPTGHADPTGHRLEFMAAFLSLLFGLLLIPLGWQLARRLRLPHPAPLLAALLLALSPFAIWYGQEVRMYTVGASLGLACLLSTLPFLRQHIRPRQPERAVAAYALATALGLYVLYYFAFLLIALNLMVLPLLGRRWWRGRHQKPAASAPLALWLTAQVVGLLLYLPWLPTALRQASDPPVPPWRSVPPLSQVLVESWTALTLGQSADPSRLWPVLLMALALISLSLVALLRSQAFQRSPARPQKPPAGVPGAAGAGMPPVSIWFLVVGAFAPLVLILLASAITPLYHVRYLFTYSPAFSLLLALGFASLWRWHAWAGRRLMLAVLVAMLAGFGLSLLRLWTDPQLAADDHRAATRELAQHWRYGDVILVNAGYTYPALLTYWPLPVAARTRLSLFEPEQMATAMGDGGPLVLQTGHVVDGQVNSGSAGDLSLGWGDPRSDFYSLPVQLLQVKMEEVAASSRRVWHYRLYDTVNDPQGLIRRQLEARWTLVDDRVYSGEANLRVQGWQANQQQPLGPALGQFDGWLNLHVLLDKLLPNSRSGSYLDLPYVSWSRAEGSPGRPANLSLRLVDETGQVWAQIDEPIGGNAKDLRQLSTLWQPLRLWIPEGTPPIDYHLELLVYDPQDSRPLAITAGPWTGRSAISLTGAVVERPLDPPAKRAALADFGPARLLRAETPATLVSPGDAVPLSLLWQATADLQGQALVVVVQVLDRSGQVVANEEAQPLAGRYPTSVWRAGELIRDRQLLPLPADIPAGSYQLIIGLYQATGRQRLTIPSGFLGLGQQDHFPIAQIEVR